MYCVMRASVPSLYNVYRRYDKNARAFAVHMPGSLTVIAVGIPLYRYHVSSVARAHYPKSIYNHSAHRYKYFYTCVYI